MKDTYYSNDDIEMEVSDYDIEEYGSDIKKPFDPNKVDIEHKILTIQNIINDINDDLIVLNPDFQRSEDCWKLKQKSRLIESVILSIPMPSFYFNLLQNDKLEVVDGLQRLSTIRDFVNGKFNLSNLEYLTDYNDLKFSELLPQNKRKILNTNIECFIIRKNTPEIVKNSIFTRLNTGGEPLTQAEIKNAMFRGKTSDFIKELASSKEFVIATRNKIKPKRMLDREYVNRFFALYFIDDYSLPIDYDKSMLDALDRIKYSNKTELSKYKKDFLFGMNRSVLLLGENAFRRLRDDGKYSGINKALYECTSVTLSKLTENEFEMINKNKFNKNYLIILKDKEFIGAITNSTFDTKNILTRYNMLKNVIEISQKN